MRIQQRPTHKPLKTVLAVLAVLLLLAGAYLAYAYTQTKWPFTSSSSTSQPASEENSVDYSGPSDSDIAESQNAKKDATPSTDTDSSSSSSPSNPSSKKTANVGISYADVNGSNLEIRAFVNNIIEGTGKCTATVTNGSSTITKSSDAFVDSSSSICEPIYIPTSQLSTGEWSVDVKYSSPTATGSSGPEKVTIP